MLNKKALAASLSAKETDADFKQTVLLLHGDGTNGAQNNTFTDSSTNAFTITRNGNTTQGTFSPFSQTGWSNYFDGSGDYISLPNSLGSGNCAVEFWCYITGEPSANPFLFDNFGNSSARLYAYYDGTTMYLNADGTTRTTTFAYNTWNFFQFTRSSGTGGWYLNGNLISTTFSTSGTIDLQRMTIGAAEESGTANSSQWTQGYISNFRASTTNRSTSVPTTAFASDSNTIVLTCQSNRFVDNSASPLTLTTTGNTSVQAFSPFAPTDAYSAGTNGGSGYFDGSGDYLSIARDSAFDVGSGNFTIECWVYASAFVTATPIFCQQQSSASARNSWSLRIDSSGNPQFQASAGSSNDVLITSSAPISLNSWNHIAGVRNGNDWTLYVNGVITGTATASITVNYDSTYGDVLFGASRNVATVDRYYTGYISSARLVKGSAVYTAGFTPPTAPLTNISNTSLLCNFTNAGIIDQTGKNNLETVGNAQIDTGTKKFGTGSLEFDGTGDYLVMKDTPQMVFGTGDFTIEFWLRLISVPSSGSFVTLYDSRPTSGSGNYPTIYLNDSNATLIYYTNNANRITGSNLSTGQWYHIAVSRSGTSTKLFIDGTQSGSTYTDSLDYTNGSFRPAIGVNGFDLSSGYLNGYIDDLRVTKGVARYTANFTAPTKAFADQ
jgi:hypothetical protein